MPNFSSFNAFGSESLETNQSHIPVWLGVVGPVPVGGTLDKAFAKPGFLLGAGAPVNLSGKIITPFVAWEVVSNTASGSNSVIVVKAAEFGGVEIAPAADDLVQKVGATFAATKTYYTVSNGVYTVANIQAFAQGTTYYTMG